MSDDSISSALSLPPSSFAAALPLPSAAISVRVATREDMPFMDALQKANSKALGFFPRAQMESYIDAGNVLIAAWHERPAHDECGGVATATGEAPVPREERVGYVIAKDRYLKRDELGAVFQLCVVPGKQRSFIGANLLREVFERSAYGCRLYCCWCAQDLPANRFWEAMGFVAIAYRAGGRRVVKVGESLSREEGATQRLNHSTTRRHIFWQKRIRANDTTTPYWFPAKTEGGAIREDRIILPIPPGMRWDDELPILMPERTAAPNAARAAKSPTLNLQPGTKAKLIEPTKKPRSGARFGPPGSLPDTVKLEALIEPPAAKPKPERVKVKADPALIAKARELRDKWMDHVAANGIASAESKYALARATPAVERSLPDLPARLAA